MAPTACVKRSIGHAGPCADPAAPEADNPLSDDANHGLGGWGPYGLAGRREGPLLTPSGLGWMQILGGCAHGCYAPGVGHGAIAQPGEHRRFGGRGQWFESTSLHLVGSVPG